MKKILSAITTVCISVNLLYIQTVNAASENLSFPTLYNFEEGFDGWELDTSKGETSLERLSEGGNSFLRLTAKSGEVFRAQDKIEVIPNGYIELDNPYKMEADSEVIISLDMRTNNNKFARNFYLNRDQLNESVRSEVQYNFATLWNWKKDNSISVFDGVTTQSVGGYPKTKSSSAFEEELENDKWYNFKTILFTDENGLPEYIQLAVSDNGEVNLMSEKKEIKNQTLRLSDKITRLDFAMGNAGVTLTADATFDIDNVRIYTETDDRFWQIKSDNEGNVFGEVDTIKIVFNGEMEKESLNYENIKLYDSEKNEIPYTGEYDERLWEYSITPDEKISNGEYTVFVDTEKVNGLKSDKSVIYGMAEDSEQEIGFVVFSGDLPEVKGLSVAGKNIPGETLTVTGEFYQENGLKGYLKYQWWYSSEKDGEYTKIENETSNTFIVPDGFSDKFIKVSAIPVSNDNVIRGEEVFSSAITPPAKPIVKNLKVTGRSGLGGRLTATSEYYQEDGIGGEIKYQWWYSGNVDGAYTKIDGETKDTLLVQDSFSDKYIKVSARAVSGMIGEGEEIFSDAIYPQVKPYAKNVTVSGVSVEGMEAVIEYVFVDENGDDEGISLFEWFISETGTGDWKKIEGETSVSYTIRTEDIGKYLMAKVTPVSTEEPCKGSVVQSNVIGPVTDMESINLVTNPGFEDGTNTGWNVNRMGGDNANVEATKADAYSGEWSGRFSGQTQNSTFMTYGVRLQGNVRYLETCMMKVAPESSVDNVNIVFYGEGNKKTTYKYMEQAVINKSDWSRVSQIISVEADGLFSSMPQFWANGTAGYVSYIDDFYFAPLLVSDISAEVPERISIPTSGEVSSDITIFAILNQIETSLGLEEETAYWEVDKDVKGVYVKDNKLYVTSDAVSGTLNLKAVCEPQFDGAIQTRFTKNYPIELITNDNKTPRINSVKIFGDTSEKSELKLEYDFYQVDSSEDKSSIKWFASDSADGEYTEVQDGGKIFNVTEEYLNCYIKAEVTPIDAEGRIGQKAVSDISGPKTSPVAEKVSISGKGYVGDVIKSNYTYYDFNDDAEGVTKFQWMRAETENGEYKEIPGATGSEYTAGTDDIDCWIKLRIIPVSVKEPFEGDAVMSGAVKGPRAPRAEDVSISVSGKVLTGKYKYVNDNGVEEGNTVCEWLVDGKVVETGARYEVDFTGIKNVEFRVTPVALSEPCKGKSVSVTKRVSGKSSGGSGGGSGGTSMSGAAQSSFAHNTIVPEVQKESAKIKDIEGHWSKAYAEIVIENKIMKVDSNGNFAPDKMVTRAEMIEYIFKAMKYQETDYRNEFSDVDSGKSYAKMLQTMVDKGIISKDINFRPDDNVTRQEVCKILSIALGFTASEFDLIKFADNNLIGDWAVPYVKNIINSNLMVGVSETEFSPRTNITNGQIAKIVCMISSGEYNKPEVGEQKENQTIGGKIDLSSNDLKVLFIGGSLTQQGKDWQNMTIDALKAKLPGKNITYENMGLGGTASGYGAMRYQNDVLSKNPDIVFIEFAVNDATMPAGSDHSRFMEEMVRQSLRSEKVPAIVFLYAPFPAGVATGEFEPWQTGVDYKEKLAEHYGIKSVNIAEYMLWDIEKQGVNAVDYVNEYYTSTGDGSWDVHGGYIKYGEAIVKAIEEDYESFLMMPKNADVYHEENAVEMNYSVIPASSDKITYTGEWIKCLQGEFSAFDEHSLISDLHFNYFGGSLMQTLKKGAEFEFTSDAEAVKLQIISSKAGNSAKVYVDGVEKGTAETYSVNAGMNYDTAWVELPNDGAEHTVKFVIDAPSSDKYVFTFGSIIERRK